MFKKKFKFFDHENMKKTPSKVAHNWPPTFFLCTGPAAQMTQKQKSWATKSPLMQDWVFRLGFYLIFGMECFWETNINIVLEKIRITFDTLRQSRWAGVWHSVVEKTIEVNIVHTLKKTKKTCYLWRTLAILNDLRYLVHNFWNITEVYCCWVKLRLLKYKVSPYAPS